MSYHMYIVQVRILIIMSLYLDIWMAIFYGQHISIHINLSVVFITISLTEVCDSLRGALGPWLHGGWIPSPQRGWTQLDANPGKSGFWSDSIRLEGFRSSECF